MFLNFIAKKTNLVKWYSTNKNKVHIDGVKLNGKTRAYRQINRDERDEY